MKEFKDVDTSQFEEMRVGDTESRKRAFDVFVAPRRSRMVGLARAKLIGSAAKENAEDAVQQALLETWKNIPHMRDDSNLDGYVNTAVASRAVGYGRSTTREQKKVKPEDITDIQNESIVANHGETAADKPLQDASYAELISTLKANMSEVFVDALIMHEVEGLDYKEIAEELNVPLGTVQSRIHRAKREARKVLKEIGR